MTETIRYSLLGAQDIRWGDGTFEVTLADGRVVTLDEVNLSHIPLISPNGTQYRLEVTDDGAIVTTAI